MARERQKKSERPQSQAPQQTQPEHVTPETPDDDAGAMRVAWSPAEDVREAFLRFHASLIFKPTYGAILDKAMRIFLRSQPGFESLSLEPPPKQKPKQKPKPADKKGATEE